MTIEPCATVLLAAGVTLNVDGQSSPAAMPSLVAHGTAAQPITFSALEASPWGSIRVNFPGTASLSYVTLGGGGSDLKFSDGATLIVLGALKYPLQQPVTVDHVTIVGPAGHGAWLSQAGGFTDASNTLAISGAGTADAGYSQPIRAELVSVGTIPSGTYTGNSDDEILVESTVVPATNNIDIHSRGVPYRMAVTRSHDFQIASATLGGSPAVLTIDPGVTLRMEPGTDIQIGQGSSPTPSNFYPGSLVAIGTSSQPIRFTSTNQPPAAGDWVGIGFYGSTTPANNLQYVSIEDAGGRAPVRASAARRTARTTPRSASSTGFRALPSSRIRRS